MIQVMGFYSKQVSCGPDESQNIIQPPDLLLSVYVLSFVENAEEIHHPDIIQGDLPIWYSVFLTHLMYLFLTHTVKQRSLNLLLGRVT